MWPSPSKVSSDAGELLGERLAQAYGVAGSRIVPITRIGGAPAAAHRPGREFGRDRPVARRRRCPSR